MVERASLIASGLSTSLKSSTDVEGSHRLMDLPLPVGIASFVSRPPIERADQQTPTGQMPRCTVTGVAIDLRDDDHETE